MTGISLQLRDRDLPAGLDLLAQMLSRPTFPRERFGLEREKVLTRLEALEDDPQVVVSNLLNREIYRGGPLRFPSLGTPASVRQLRIEDVRRFHRLRYSPRNTILVVVGNAGSAPRRGTGRKWPGSLAQPPIPQEPAAGAPAAASPPDPATDHGGPGAGPHLPGPSGRGPGPPRLPCSPGDGRDPGKRAGVQQPGSPGSSGTGGVSPTPPTATCRDPPASIPDGSSPTSAPRRRIARPH